MKCQLRDGTYVKERKVKILTVAIEAADAGRKTTQLTLRLGT